MVVNDFPVILLEVISNAQEADKIRMLLQASCLVRLGNALLVKPEFLIKAIYVDNDYRATVFTLFLDPNDPVSIYSAYCR